MRNRDPGWTSAELSLAGLAVSLGAGHYGGPLSGAEARLVAAAAGSEPPPDLETRCVAEQIREGDDPLGDRLVAARTKLSRRNLGQVLTPRTIVEPMVEWALEQTPMRVVDAGCGSGRFAMEAARRTGAEIIAVDTDPLATVVTRAALASLKTKPAATVINADYTQMVLPLHAGRTAFIGNPPYVRHHQLSATTKAWGHLASQRFGLRLSGLAGLHAYFFLATAIHGNPGDIGCFVTSSEWLDVNYGGAVRRLLMDGLGGRSVHVIDPTNLPFDHATTTAAITCFEIGARPDTVRMRSVARANELRPLNRGRRVTREQLAGARRWTPLLREAPDIPSGYVELGELCRVHRGQVTGSNATWVVPPGAGAPVPERYLFPSITRARELIAAGRRLRSTDGLRRVIDLPVNLDELEVDELVAVEEFLDRARADGVADGYVARHRRAWWAVGLRAPAPILATYMARNPPTFVRNDAGARHINIAHGIYPRQPLPDDLLDRLAGALRRAASSHLGRTYAGGLVKFEPREMERIPVPSPELLQAG